jgi:hypothetical protein
MVTLLVVIVVVLSTTMAYLIGYAQGLRRAKQIIYNQRLKMQKPPY